MTGGSTAATGLLEIVATIEDRKIYRGRSTLFGEVLAHVDGDRVIAGSSAWGDVIARIDGNRVISGASTWGDVIATVENGGHMSAGAWFVLSEIMGQADVRLYDGSMHEWSTLGRPVVGLGL